MATITTGGAAQDALAESPVRTAYWLQNQSAGDLYWRDDGTDATATADCRRLAPGAYYETPAGYSNAGGRVSVIGATTGQAFAAGKG